MINRLTFHAWPMCMSIVCCCICKKDSSDYTSACGYNFHFKCYKNLFQSFYFSCPCGQHGLRTLEMKYIPRSCEVCGAESCDFVTRCGHFIHRRNCAADNNSNSNSSCKIVNKCPVCKTRISHSQREEMLHSRMTWTEEDLETSCPLSYLELAIMACENSRFIKKISFDFVTRKKLLEHGFRIDVIVYHRSGLNLLGIATRSGNVEAIKELVKLSSTYQVHYDYYDAPVLYAVKNDNQDLLTFLVHQKVKLSYSDSIVLTALESLDGDGIIFGRLVELGLDPKRLLYHKETFLMYAVREEYYDSVVKLVDQYQVDVNWKSNRGETALLIASERVKDLRIIDFLVERAAETEFSFSNWPIRNVFFAACEFGNFVAVQRLFEVMQMQSHLNSFDSKGRTPLSYAAESGQLETVNFLTSNGAKVNLPTKSGSLPINYACANVSILKRLLELGCDLNKLSPNVAELPIHHLCKVNYKFLERMKQLVELGADVNARDRKGRTALHHCSLENNYENAEVLLGHFAVNVNIKDNYGALPIDLARDKKMIKLLLKFGSKPTNNFYRMFKSCFTD